MTVGRPELGTFDFNYPPRTGEAFLPGVTQIFCHRESFVLGAVTLSETSAGSHACSCAEVAACPVRLQQQALLVASLKPLSGVVFSGATCKAR